MQVRALWIALSLLSAGLLGTAAGCASAAGPVSLERAPLAASWADDVKEHTRHAEIYQGPVRELDVRAVLVTPRLRRAFLAHRAELAGAIVDQTAREFTALVPQPDEGADAPTVAQPSMVDDIVIVVGAFISDQKSRDLAASYSGWTTSLVTSKARVRAKHFETLKNSPALIQLFPFIDRFDEVHIVRFPGQDPVSGQTLWSTDNAPMALELRSAYGTAVATWVVTP